MTGGGGWRGKGGGRGRQGGGRRDAHKGAGLVRAYSWRKKRETLAVSTLLCNTNFRRETELLKDKKGIWRACIYLCVSIIQVCLQLGEEEKT